MYKITKTATQKDILSILSNPWFLTKNEWGLLDHGSLKNASYFLKYQIKRCKQDGFVRLWKSTKYEPIALLGFFNIAPKIYETFFIGSNHMDTFSLKVSFDLQKILRLESENYKGCKCVIYSSSDHPKQIKWFQFLGFTYKPEGNVGTAKHFVYESR